VAKGSQTGWFGLEPHLRFCAGCGQKMTLAPPKGHVGPLDDWHQVHQEFPQRAVWHARCYRDRRVAA